MQETASLFLLKNEVRSIKANVQVCILALPRSGFFALRPDLCGISVESGQRPGDFFARGRASRNGLIFQSSLLPFNF